MSLILAFLITFSSSFGSETANCVPENNRRIPSFVEGSGVSKAQYLKTVNRLKREYEPAFVARQAKLRINDLWFLSEVRAYTLKLENEFQVNVMGGLARHPLMNEDALILVFCHELGHHLGGSPRELNNNWLVVEGQADYFATLKCTRQIFSQEDNSWYLNSDTNSHMRQECEMSFQSKKEIALCMRSTAAGLTLALINADLRNTPVAPRFTTPDQKVVEELKLAHPQPQCRLDTYVAGAICPVQVSLELSDYDLDNGACSRWYGQTRGVRPLCWYDEKLNFSYIHDLNSNLKLKLNGNYPL